jgi:hypothetical protein
MAAREHRVSRRALLGAACAFPLVRHPGLDPGSISSAGRESRIPDRVRNDENWRTAIARLRRAEARLKALAHEPDEDLFDNANAVFNHALKKLVRTPAPDLPALALGLLGDRYVPVTVPFPCSVTGTYLSPSHSQVRTCHRPIPLSPSHSPTRHSSESWNLPALERRSRASGIALFSSRPSRLRVNPISVAKLDFV